MYHHYPNLKLPWAASAAGGEFRLRLSTFGREAVSERSRCEWIGTTLARLVLRRPVDRGIGIDDGAVHVDQ
jgi:hypothetical protein